jgi:hypothetical protein
MGYSDTVNRFLAHRIPSVSWQMAQLYMWV